MILKPFAFELSNPNSNTVIPELARGNRTTVHEVADEFGYGSAEHVIAHAKRQSARGKAPSMHFDGISNPKLALASAEAKIANDKRMATALEAASVAIDTSRDVIVDQLSDLTQEKLDKIFGGLIQLDGNKNIPPADSSSHRTTVHEVADEFGYGSAEHVIAHAKRQSARGKAPSMHFDGISNPKLALASAEAKIANKNELANVVNEAQRVLADGQAELARTMSELDRVIFVDWTGGSNNMPRLGGYVIPSRLASQYVDLHQRAVAGPDHTVYNTIHDQGYPSIGFGSPEGTEGRWGSVITPAEVCGKFALESVRIA